MIALEEAFDNPDLNNIGIIVDANNEGPNARLETLKGIVSRKGFKDFVNDATLTNTGLILNGNDSMPTLGIWIMPDNESNGYLEHFLTNLIDHEDFLWQFVESTIEDLQNKNLQLFSPLKSQKAKIYTWLSWQSEPGRPFGQAIAMGFLNPLSNFADNFEDWFRATFELSS